LSHAVLLSGAHPPWIDVITASDQVATRVGFDAGGSGCDCQWLHTGICILLKSAHHFLLLLAQHLLAVIVHCLLASLVLSWLLFGAADHRFW